MKKMILLLLILITSPSWAVQIQARVIGGTVSADDAWPSVVAVRMTVYDKRNIPLERRCAGTLIASRWVMTAAHCFFPSEAIDSEMKQDATPVNTTVFIDHRQISSSTLRSESGLPVSNIHINPLYIADSGQYDNDIALVELTYPVETIPTMTLGADPRWGEMAKIVGWGVTEVGLDGQPKASAHLVDQLHEADLPIVSTLVCKEAMGAGNITQNMLCAGYKDGGVDSCVGDSGGPLLVREAGVYKQVGIVSFGDGCAKPDRYGVYTRVPMYSAWISELTGLNVRSQTSAQAQNGSRAGDGTADVAVQPRSVGGGVLGWYILLLSGLAGVGRERA